MITTPSGLQYEDTVTGSGAVAAKGQRVRVHYTGWLYDPTAANNRGKKFDSSKDRGDPFAFPLGAGHVIGGWDEGVQGMAVGGTRVLLIPPELIHTTEGVGDTRHVLIDIFAPVRRDFRDKGWIANAGDYAPPPS